MQVMLLLVLVLPVAASEPLADEALQPDVRPAVKSEACLYCPLQTKRRGQNLRPDHQTRTAVAEYADTAQVAIQKPAPGAAVTPPGDPNNKIKEIAGTAEFLRLLPKRFATIQTLDANTRTIALLFVGETVAKAWPVEPDAEVKVAGGWGRLEQFQPGDRVWTWLKLDRKKQPVSVVMLADS